MREFNDVVEMFNPTMNSLYRSQYMTKVPREQLLNYNYGGYPRINMDNENELEWWDFNEDYKRRIGESTAAQSGLTAATAVTPTTQP